MTYSSLRLDEIQAGVRAFRPETPYKIYLTTLKIAVSGLVPAVPNILRTDCPMSEASNTTAQLPPSSEIQNYSLTATSENWFEYPVRAHPNHTDYSGAVWHGTYLTWMEEARVECLRSIGIDYADLVALGCELPVVELSLRYHRPIRMGMAAIVKTRMAEMEGVRINWDYQIQSLDGDELYLTGRVTLVAVDSEKGKILRQLPSAVKDALVKLSV